MNPSRTASPDTADVADAHRSASTSNALGRLAAGAGWAAVLVTGALVTREWWRPAEETLGFGPYVLALYWGLAAALLACLVVPVWRGSTWGRRLLGLLSLGGFVAAMHWLSYEPSDAQSFAVGISVAVLFAVATGASTVAERRLHAHRSLVVLVMGVLGLALAAGLWRVSSATETMAAAAELSVSADGRTVRSDFATDPCSEPLRLEIVETPQEVRVLTLITMSRGFPRGCSGQAVPRRLEATLDAPLGQRILGPM